MIQNIPEVKLGLIAVSRGCFPMALAERRRTALHKACKTELYECPVTVENECDARKAVDDVLAHGVNALVVFLGNFGPETPETLIADWFDGPVMYVAAAEGDGDLHRRPRRRLLRSCSTAATTWACAASKAYIPEYSRGHCRRAGRPDGGVPAHRPRHSGPEGPEDDRLRPPAPRLPGLQRPHQGAVRSGRGRGGKLRAGSAGRPTTSMPTIPASPPR